MLLILMNRMARLLQTPVFLLCPLIFALAIFLSEFECPLTGLFQFRLVDNENQVTREGEVQAPSGLTGLTDKTDR